MFKDNKDFYPTPKSLSDKMLSKVQFISGMKVLEPSAGKGDLAKQVLKEYEKQIGKTASRHTRMQPIDLDVIERDKNLQHILKGEGLRLVSNDFLKNRSEKWYDLIVMNPPFSDGVKHVLKAVEMVSKGGQLVALLNAANIKNPNTIYEKDLVRKIGEYEAEVEYLEGEFATSEAERKTNVEVALIYFDIKAKRKRSVIVDELKKDIEFEKANEKIDEDDELYAVVTSDMVQSIVEQYQFEVKAGLRLIDEFYSAKKHFLRDFEGKAGSILKLTLSSDRDAYYSPKRKTLRNDYIKEVRAKYWNTLFSSREFESLFTSKVRSDYRNQVEKLVDYDFSVFNILQIQEDLSRTIFGSIEEAIIGLFDEFSHKYYYDESSKNVHLYNGWKTNKSWKVNKKVIIPLNAYDSWSRNLEYDYKIRDKMNDLEKAMSYLDAKAFDPTVLENALKETKTNKLETNYYSVIFYKKGTAHIQFKDLDLLKRFNIIGSMLKGWLPPSYGEKEYKDMNVEEQDVINSFEGEKSYAEVLANKEYFLEQPRDRKIELPSEGFIKLGYTATEPEVEDVQTKSTDGEEIVEAVVKEGETVEAEIIEIKSETVIVEAEIVGVVKEQNIPVQKTDIVLADIQPGSIIAASVETPPGVEKEVEMPIEVTTVVSLQNEVIKPVNELKQEVVTEASFVEVETKEIVVTQNTIIKKPDRKTDNVEEMVGQKTRGEDIEEADVMNCEAEQMSLF